MPAKKGSDDAGGSLPTGTVHQDPSAPKTPSARSDSTEGRMFGAYRAQKEIGRGGMGAVYVGARADDQFRKRVAIKVLKRGMDTDDVVRRFRNERQILASVDHPNIARLLDGGVSEDGLPYFVMEYVEGQPIDAYCEARKLTVTERLSLFRKVCSAVQFAHQNLVVHRDLKPRNVLVTPEGEPKLLDFGIAKLLNPDLSAVTAAPTVLEERLMTPEYASPEQARGEPITTASDVYSLGVVLYELLTGQRPYEIGKRTIHDIVRVVAEQEPARPSVAITTSVDPRNLLTVRSPASEGKPAGDASETVKNVRSLPEGSRDKLRRRLSGDLDNIVLLAMRKEPDRRYRSVEQLSEDIRRHLEGHPVTARPDTLGYRTRKFLLRNRGAVAAAALVVASLSAAAVVSTWQARVASTERDRARLAAAQAEQINAFVQEMLASADPSDPTTGRRDVTVAEVLAKAAARVDTELSGQPEVGAAIRQTIGRTFLGLGLFAEAERQLTLAHETLKELHGEDHPDTASSLSHLASLEERRGELDAAETLFRRVLDVQRRALEPNDPKLAATLTGFASVLRAKGDFDAAASLQREALQVRREAYGSDHWDVAHSLNNLGVTLGSQGDFEGAEPLHREALEILRRVRPREDPSSAAVMAALAFALDNQGKYDEAEPLYREALEIRTRILGEEHPDVAWTKYNYADFLNVRGKYEESERLAREILTLRETTLPDSHPVVGATLLLIGKNRMQSGSPGDAEPWLRESIRLRRGALPADHWLLASAESYLGECLFRLRRYDAAEQELTTSLRTLSQKLGESHPRTQSTIAVLAELSEARMRPEEAAAYRARLAKAPR